jgi:hypothetical protein
MPAHRHIDLKSGALDRRRRMARARKLQSVRHSTLPLRQLMRHHLVEK